MNGLQDSGLKLIADLLGIKDHKLLAETQYEAGMMSRLLIDKYIRDRLNSGIDEDAFEEINLVY